jgi:hypothetical protein
MLPARRAMLELLVALRASARMFCAMWLLSRAASVSPDVALGNSAQVVISAERKSHLITGPRLSGMAS